MSSTVPIDRFVTKDTSQLELIILAMSERIMAVTVDVV